MFMSACFGLHSGYRGARFPADRLVEAHARLDVIELYRGSVLLEGVETTVRVAEKDSLLAIHASNLLVDGTCVGIIWDHYGRPWFSCPRCSRRRRHIYMPEIACRTCLSLDYAVRHVHQHLPAVHRITRLRRAFHVDPRPFAQLPARPRSGHSRAYHDRYVAAIQAEESKLLGHLGTVVSDLKRRVRIRKLDLQKPST
jgi:hypothetical protein